MVHHRVFYRDELLDWEKFSSFPRFCGGEVKLWAIQYSTLLELIIIADFFVSRNFLIRCLMSCNALLVT